MLNRLIKIADLLDKLGYEEDASFVDSLIGEQADQEEIEIPEDEYDALQMIHESLMESLNSPVRLS